MQEDPELRRTLWFLLGGKRGGANRARIIWNIREEPSNINQLATKLDLQYKAVQHHIRVLVGSALLAPSGEGYGAVYLLTPWFEHHFGEFTQICTKLGFERPGFLTGAAGHEVAQDLGSQETSGFKPSSPE